LERQVAIQRIAEERARERYEREAQAGASPRDISTGRQRRAKGAATDDIGTTWRPSDVERQPQRATGYDRWRCRAHPLCSCSHSTALVAVNHLSTAQWRSNDPVQTGMNPPRRVTFSDNDTVVLGLGVGVGGQDVQDTPPLRYTRPDASHISSNGGPRLVEHRLHHQPGSQLR